MTSDVNPEHGGEPDDLGEEATVPTVDSDGEATPCAYTEYPSGREPQDLPATGEDAEAVEARIWDALSDVEDPEMPISIVDLGLVYGVEVADGDATVEMTLTYTGCPARNMLTRDVESAVESVDGVEAASVRLVWTPEWSVDMVTDDGKEDLREFGLSV